MLVELHGGGQVEKRAQATRASFLAARSERVKAEELLHSDGALYWLRNAADAGFPCYPWYARDPLLQPLRGHPEFQQFLGELPKLSEAAKTRYAG